MCGGREGKEERETEMEKQEESQRQERGRDRQETVRFTMCKCFKYWMALLPFSFKIHTVIMHTGNAF